MKNYNKFILTLLFLGLFISGMSQTKSDIQQIQLQSNVTELRSLSDTYRKETEINKQKALQLADEYGWKTTILKKNGTQSELMGVSDDGKSPIYYETDNVDAAISTRTNFLNVGGGLGLNLNGQNMTAYVWDGGPTLPTHDEFDNRVTIGDGNSTIVATNLNSHHANHVTGTIVAAGTVAAARGMAFQANARTNEWNNDLAEVTTASANGMLVSNHSYGWRLRDNTGAVIMAAWRFGNYESTARNWDNVMYNAPYYLNVKSAGNDGLDNTANTSPLGGFNAFDKLTGTATCKNNLVVANANDATIGTNGILLGVAINTRSSQGPTDDLRIKPDITGNGTNLFSTGTLSIPITTLSNTSYGGATGTSMASPNITGTLLLLQQHYRNLTGEFMRAATLKGLALHTADDAGPIGPDANFGWGLMNARFAAETITDNGTNTIVQEHTLYNGDSYSFDVVSDGINPLEASISWTDPAGNAYFGSTSNIGTSVLINDLDIRVTNGAGTNFPFRLTSPTTNGLGDNTVDPYEKISITGAAGTYTVTITHKGNLVNDLQKYSVIVTGITQPTTDLYTKDRPFDNGIEPNPDNGPMWISEDIWVRKNLDGGLTHENPEYKTTSPNGVYIRVRNRGTSTTSAAKVKLYYTKASTGLVWPTNFIDFSIGGLEHGDEIGEASIPSIASGASAVVVIPWFPPNPADFTYDIHHFCLASRIETANDPMLNEVTGVNIGINAKTNNNISWKNLSVYDLNATDNVQSTAVFIRGMRSDYINLRFSDRGFKEDLKYHFFELGGEIVLTFDKELFERAREYGSLKGLEIIDEYKVLINSRDAIIAQLPIKKGETFAIELDFRIEKDIALEHPILLDVIQEGTKTETIEGGERFVLYTTKRKSKKFRERLVRSKEKLPLMKLSPNPNSGLFKVVLTDKSPGQLIVTDLFGQTVFEKKNYANQEITIDISKRTTGLYIVKYTSDTGVIVFEKFIKQ